MKISASILVTLICFTGVSSALSGCASEPQTDVAPEPATALIGEWTLSEMRGGAVSIEGRQPTLIVKPDGGIMGFSGVNRYGGKLDAAAMNAGKLVVGALASTRMAGPAEAMKLEGDFLKTLGEVDSFEIKGGVLSMRNSSGVLAKFVRK